MLDRVKLRELSMTLRAAFLSRLAVGAAEYRALAEKLAMVVQSSDEKIIVRWLGELPVLRKWVGDRYATELAAKAWEFMMSDYEATVRVHENDVKYDRLGLIRPRINELASQTLKMPMREIAKLLAAGFGTTLGKCYDDLALFSGSHANGSNTGTEALDATAFEAAYDAMVSQKDANDEDLDIQPTHIWFHPSLRSKVKEIIGTQKLDGGADNPNYQLVEPLPIRGLPASAANYWGLLDLSKELKPFWFAEHPEGAQFVALDQPESEPRFKRKELVFGVEKTGGVAYGFPQLIWGSNGTT